MFRLLTTCVEVSESSCPPVVKAAPNLLFYICILAKAVGALTLCLTAVLCAAQFSEGALDTVCTACQSALDALDEKLFGKGDADAAATAGDTRSRTVTARAGTVTAALKTGKLGGAAAQTKRPGQEADGERFSYAITAARRSEQRKLLNFIRLADYMLCGSLHSLLIESIQEILARMIIDEADRVRVSEDASDAEESTNGGEEMQVDGGQTQGEEAGKTGSLPLFRVEVVMDEDQLVFEPSQIAFQTKVRYWTAVRCCLIKE